MHRRTTCRRCGATITQPPAQGRPRQFCSDRCRRQWAKMLEPLPSGGILEPPWRAAGLLPELRGTMAKCEALSESLGLQGYLEAAERLDEVERTLEEAARLLDVAALTPPPVR